MSNIVQHNIRNEAMMLQDFQRNSPDGRFRKHPPQGHWEGYVEKFQYNQEFGTFSRMEWFETLRHPQAMEAGAMGRQDRRPSQAN